MMPSFMIKMYETTVRSDFQGPQPHIAQQIGQGIDVVDPNIKVKMYFFKVFVKMKEEVTKYIKRNAKHFKVVTIKFI